MSMPRFYFHARQGEEVIRDERGIEFDTLLQARDEAIKAIREMIGEALNASTPPATFEIANENGEILMLVRLEDALGGDAELSSGVIERIDLLNELTKRR
jgi:hypothetical protein